MKPVVSLDIDGVLTNLYKGVVFALRQLPNCPDVIFSKLSKLRIHKIEEELVPFLLNYLSEKDIKQFKKELFKRVFIRKIWFKIFNKYDNRFDFVCVTNRPLKYKNSTEKALKLFKPFIKNVLYKEDEDEFKIKRLKRVNAFVHIDDDVDVIKYLTKKENFNCHLFLGEPVLLNNKGKLALHLNVLELHDLNAFFSKLVKI